MSNKIIKVLIRLTQIAALTLAGVTAAYAYPANCPVGSASTQPTLCSACHTSFLSPSKDDYNGGCLVDPNYTTTTTSSTSTSSTTSSTNTSGTDDTSSDTDVIADTSTDADAESHKDHKGHKRDHKEHKRHTWLDSVGYYHANEHSRFFRDPHDYRLHRHESD